jgi:hypothetical protein
MLELLIGAILLAPICGLCFAGSRLRHRVLASVVVAWLVVVAAFVIGYSVSEFAELDTFDASAVGSLQDIFTVAGSEAWQATPSFELTTDNILLFLCAALVGLVEVSRVKNTREIVGGILAMFFFAAAVTLTNDVLLLAAWLALDCVAGFLIPYQSSRVNDHHATSVVAPLVRVAPSILLFCAMLESKVSPVDPNGFDLGLAELAAFLRFGLFCWAHGAFSCRRLKPDSKGAETSQGPPVLWPLLCYALPAVHHLTRFGVKVDYIASAAVVFCAVIIAASIAALSLSSDVSRAMRILPIVPLTIAVSCPRAHTVYLLCCQLPLLCVIKELLTNRELGSQGSLIVVTTLMLVSGIWGQAFVSNVTNGWAAYSTNMNVLLLGFGVSHFFYCATVTRLVTLRLFSSSSDVKHGASKPLLLMCVIGIVACVVPAITMSLFYLEWANIDFPEVNEYLRFAFGVTSMTPVLLVGALCGWYFTKPAKGIGDWIAALCRPIRSVAVPAKYLRSIAEACVSYPIRIASFICEKLDSHVIGASGEDAWKSTVSDVGNSLDSIRRLDIRYSTLCGLLAVVGILLALWMGV